MQLADFALERHFARWEFRRPAPPLRVRRGGLADGRASSPWPTMRRGCWGRPSALGYAELLRTSAAAGRDRPPLRGAGSRRRPGLSCAEEAIFCLLNVLLGQGDHAIVTWPGYQSLHEVARRGRRRGDPPPAPRGRRAGRLTWKRLVTAIRPATRAVVVNAPHNPTGTLPTPRPSGGPLGGVPGLAAPVGRRGLPVSWRHRREGAPWRRGPSWTRPSSRSGVLSKFFALAGLRIGWLASRDRDLLARWAWWSTTTPRSAPRLPRRSWGSSPPRGPRDRPCPLATRPPAGAPTWPASTSSSPSDPCSRRGSGRPAGQSASRASAPASPLIASPPTSSRPRASSPAGAAPSGTP